MKIKAPFVIIFLSLLFTDKVHSQQTNPKCLNALVNMLTIQHKNNPCEGSDKLLRVEQYSYKDTLLYKLVFEKTRICPDYISSTVFYNSNCEIMIRIQDGGLKYRHEVLPARVNEKEIKFIKSINWNTENKQSLNSSTTIPVDINERGNTLKKFYLSLNVENFWIAGYHINWETGIADRADATQGNHTHCSAFVAAACKKLDVYILRPPEHGQVLLANAQYDWFQTGDAHKNGWTPITNVDKQLIYLQAQNLANTGKIVVAIFKNPDATKPGHTALVMPKKKSITELNDEGPELIMAGTHNFNFIPLKKGFRNHITSWPENEIKFFVNNNTLPVQNL